MFPSLCIYKIIVTVGHKDILTNQFYLPTEERATQLLARLPESTWRWGEHGGFASKLGIPYDEQSLIAAKYPLNDDRVSAAVKGLQENSLLWRAIVCALDAVEESTLADEAREFLEPPAGEIM